MVVPLATLLGLAERPGEVQGFGLLDPALARDLAAAAVASPRTQVCVTITSPEGYAIAHGCARLKQQNQPGHKPQPGPENQKAAGIAATSAALPARLNITVPAAALPFITGNSGHTAPWALSPPGVPPLSNETTSPSRTGPPPSADGPGTWTLTTPGGQQFTLRFDPVPVYDCDHTYETPAYQPTAKLRHLVQVRDGACTFPSCNRHARESDFEHATPYDQGGRTCACNAGARSRACHHIKQAPGWTVTQPQPGWHQWQTPSGHIYIQEPKRYPL